MVHIQQPEGSRICGQCCLAMLLNISLFEAIIAVGHDHGTYTREIIAVLRRYGWQCSDRLMRIKKDGIVPKTCLIHMVFKENKKVIGRHWLLMHDNIAFDPSREQANRICFGEVVSYLRLQAPER